MTKEYVFIQGAVLRLNMLMTHYRSPLNHSEKRLEEASTILERWGKACIPCNDGPPLEILEALCDDCNTPKAIAAMHVYRKQDGRKLFAALRYFGFFNDGVCTPDEIKTLPDGQSTGNPGPDTVGLTQ